MKSHSLIQLWRRIHEMGKSSTCFCPTGGGDGNIADCFSSVSLHCRVNPVSVVGHLRIDCIPALLDDWNHHIWEPSTANIQEDNLKPATITQPSQADHSCKDMPVFHHYCQRSSVVALVVTNHLSFGLKFPICGEYIHWPLTWQVFFLVMPPENKVVRLQHCWLWWQCWDSSVVLLFLSCTCTEHARKNGSRCWWVVEG